MRVHMRSVLIIDVFLRIIDHHDMLLLLSRTFRLLEATAP